MNFDISTPEGMANAVEWQRALVARITQGGSWIVPRSGTVVQLDHANKHAKMAALLPEPTIVRVFQEMGWTVEVRP